MKPATLIQQTKQKYAHNLLFIQQELKMSELELDHLMVEVGCKFLEQDFPRNDPYYDKWYKEYSYAKSFWKWWKLEWNNWLTQLIDKQTFYNGITLQQAMELLIHRNGTKHSFNSNYIKLIHNGETQL